MKEINDLIRKIGETIVASIPGDFDWEATTYYTKILITYSQSRATAIDKQGRDKSLSINFEPAYPNFVWQLREAMYNQTPEKGAWYLMEMTIKKDGKFELKFDYDNKPDFNIPIENIDYIRDNEKFPRIDELKPDWLKDILAGKS